MLSGQAGRTGAILAAIGLAAALLATSSAPADAGPFQWLTGKNQQQQQQPPPEPYQQQPQQQQSGNNPGFFPFFGGKGNRPNRGYQGGPDPTAAPRASELPANDPEAYMITNPPLGTPTLSLRNVAATQSAIQRYQSIAAQGGWPMVPAKAMHPGQRGPEIAALQRRLEVSGDLAGMSVPGEYDAAVVQAVKNFQSRHGLPATGKIDSKAMIEALNVPASIRVAQLQASLKRLQGLNTGGGRYVVVSGNYQSGTSVVDFSNPRNATEFAWSDPPPIVPPDLGGAWSSYWYNNFIYETNITEGLNIFRFSGSETAGAIRLGHLNPQTQEFTIG